MNTVLNKQNNIFKNTEFHRLKYENKGQLATNQQRNDYKSTFLNFGSESNKLTNSQDTSNVDKKQDKKNTGKKLAFIALAALALSTAYFGGKKLSNKTSTQLTFKDGEFDKLKEQTDDILGKGFFEGKLKDAGWKLDGSDIKDPTFFQDVKATLYDLYGNIVDFVDWVTQKKINTSTFVQRREYKNKNRAKDLVLKIIKQYKSVDGDPKAYNNAMAKNIRFQKPQYKPRDERVLVGLSTGVVSTIFAGNDFYNISMIQKDDKDEANKSANAKMKQEATRRLLSAVFTFFTMGSLDKYIKNSKPATIASAGLSALFADVFSRLITKTPLKPLSQKEAKIYAQKNKKNTKNDNKTSKTSAEETKEPTNKDVKNSIFKDFLNDNGNFASVDIMNKAKAKQKKSKFMVGLGIASVLLSAYYLLSSSKKTDKYIKQFYDVTKLSALKDFITKKKEVIDIEKFKTQISQIQTEKVGDTVLAEAKGMNPLLNTYQDMIEYLEKNTDKIKNGKITVSQDRFLIAALYNGFEKMGKTIAFLLSAPARALKGACKIATKTQNKTPDNTAKDYLDSIVQLHKIINNKKLTKTEDKLDEILKRAREAKTIQLDMGDLASDCRTIMTLISTFFFVSDYRNRVLIESEGEDIEGAKAEQRARIAHKAFNFVFNGVLMNIFNKLFQAQYNSHLYAVCMVSALTEFCNEKLIRFSICSPSKRMKSKDSLYDYYDGLQNKNKLYQAYVKKFMKISGKKNIFNKASNNTNETTKQKA